MDVIPGSVPPDRWSQALAHRERLLALARARVVVAEDAEDVVQEAMLRCATFERLDDERLGQFLTSVTLRLCVDEHRRRETAARLARKLPVDPDEPGADEPVCARAEATWAAELVRELPATQQAIIEARANGLSYEEISRRRRTSYKSVESAVARARSTVRRALAGSLGVVGVLRRHADPSAVAAVGCVAAAVAIGVGSVPATPARPAATPTVRRVEPATRTAGLAGPPAAVRLVRPADVARAATPPRLPAVRPAASPSPYVTVPGYSVGPDERDDEYSTQERVIHCVTYGVALTPSVHCRYPDEGPGSTLGGPR